jgi:carbon monoxide dehydrogenase subunit G
VGPIAAKYSGIVVIEELDEAGMSMKLSAQGNQQGAQGHAQAHLQFSVLSIDDNRSELHVDGTGLVGGKIAQVGSGMFRKFGENLLKELARA